MPNEEKKGQENEAPQENIVCQGDGPCTESTRKVLDTQKIMEKLQKLIKAGRLHIKSTDHIQVIPRKVLQSK